MTETIHIAMWSGPRNLSTAMMRSFGARPDTVCVDEPFYAPFLAISGLHHPMRDDILAGHETNPETVADQMIRTGPVIHYQKQMTHHMVEGIPRAWIGQVRNAFLIRHPARVLASYARKMETASLEAIGFPQQAELYELAKELSPFKPVIIDSDDILSAPEPALTALCRALGIPFDREMLSWAAGSKREDGAWAPHWYDAVNASTGFGSAPGRLPDVDPAHQEIYEAAMPIYLELAKEALSVSAPD